MRIQYELSEKENAELEKMMEDTAISTKRDLFNNALTLFEWAIKEIKKGRVIAAQIELAMPSLSRVVKQEEDWKMDCDEKKVAVTAALSLACTLSGLAIIAHFFSPGVVCGLALVLIGSDIDFAFRLGNIQKLFTMLANLPRF